MSVPACEVTNVSNLSEGYFCFSNNEKSQTTPRLLTVSAFRTTHSEFSASDAITFFPSVFPSETFLIFFFFFTNLIRRRARQYVKHSFEPRQPILRSVSYPTRETTNTQIGRHRFTVGTRHGFSIASRHSYESPH